MSWNITIYGTKYSRMDQVKFCGRQPLKNLNYHITWNFLKAVFHKFHLVHSWIIYPTNEVMHPGKSQYIPHFYQPIIMIVIIIIIFIYLTSKIYNSVVKQKKEMLTTFDKKEYWCEQLNVSNISYKHWGYIFLFETGTAEF